jgi:hypothetical protein
MDKHLTLQKRKTIIQQIFSELSTIVDCFQIKTNNFSILAIKVLERTRSYPDLTSANRYQISLDVLTQMAKELDISESEKTYLLSAIPSMIFDLSDINLRGQQNQKQIKNDKKKRAKQLKKNPDLVNNGVFKVEEYVSEIYNKIAKMIITQYIKPSDLPSQLINIVMDSVGLINTFVELRGIEKKQLLVRAFQKFNDNLEEIFPGITTEEANLVKLAINTLPSLIDSVIAVIEAKFNVNLDDVFTSKFWTKIFKNCKNGCAGCC